MSFLTFVSPGVPLTSVLSTSSFVSPSFPPPRIQTFQSHRGRSFSNATRASASDPSQYEKDEMLSSGEDMSVWNSVIHASLKRKLHTLISEENPVTSAGVSSLLSHAPSPSALSSTTAMLPPAPPPASDPEQLVERLLTSFKTDALSGATTFVAIASPKCHVKHTNPHTLLLFIGDNDAYRPLLRLHSFRIHNPRYEQTGDKCVLSVDVHLPNVGSDDSAKFDFQLSLDKDNSTWLIDEVFRL